MSEVLHAVDFEKLKIENQQYAERIEERSAELAKQKDSLAAASTTVTRLKRQLDEAGARMRQLQADMDQKRYYMGTFDANLAVAEKEHAAAYKLNKNLLSVQQHGESVWRGVREERAQLLELWRALGEEAGGCAEEPGG